MTNDALRDALRYFVDAGKMVLELGPIRTQAVSVMVAAEEAGTLWLTCERTGALAELLREDTGARIRFVQDERQLELAGPARCVLDPRKTEDFDHVLLTQTLGVPHHKRMLVELRVVQARLRDSGSQSGTHRRTNEVEASAVLALERSA